MDVKGIILGSKIIDNICYFVKGCTKPEYLTLCLAVSWALLWGTEKIQLTCREFLL